MYHSVGFCFRSATSADTRAIAALHADSWRRHYRGAYSDRFLDGDVEMERFGVWATRLEERDGSTITVVGQEQGTLVGFIHVVFSDDPVWGSLVDNLHVTYTHKRRGIGSRLMAEAARAVIEHGPGGLYLWVLEQNAAAQGFYEALGGRRVERSLAAAPSGDRTRLNGAPAKLRLVWQEPARLLRLRPTAGNPDGFARSD